MFLLNWVNLSSTIHNIFGCGCCEHCNLNCANLTLFSNHVSWHYCSCWYKVVSRWEHFTCFWYCLTGPMNLGIQPWLLGNKLYFGKLAIISLNVRQYLSAIRIVFSHWKWLIRWNSFQSFSVFTWSKELKIYWMLVVLWTAVPCICTILKAFV